MEFLFSSIACVGHLETKFIWRNSVIYVRTYVHVHVCTVDWLNVSFFFSSNVDLSRGKPPLFNIFSQRKSFSISFFCCAKNRATIFLSYIQYNSVYAPCIVCVHVCTVATVTMCTQVCNVHGLCLVTFLSYGFFSSFKMLSNKSYMELYNASPFLYAKESFSIF